MMELNTPNSIKLIPRFALSRYWFPTLLFHPLEQFFHSYNVSVLWLIAQNWHTKARARRYRPRQSRCQQTRGASEATAWPPPRLRHKSASASAPTRRWAAHCAPGVGRRRLRSGCAPAPIEQPRVLWSSKEDVNVHLNNYDSVHNNADLRQRTPCLCPLAHSLAHRLVVPREGWRSAHALVLVAIVRQSDAAVAVDAAFLC